MNKPGDHGLSDALRNLASGNPQPDTPEKAQPVSRSTPVPPAGSVENTGEEPEEEVVAFLEDEAGDQLAAAPAPQRSAKPQAARRTPATPQPKARTPQPSGNPKTSPGAPKSGVKKPGTPAQRGSGGLTPLQQLAAPVLATTGLLLLVPAAWATLSLAGVNMLGDDRPQTGAMTWAMLAAWPVAIVLIAAGAFLMVKMLRAKKS